MSLFAVKRHDDKFLCFDDFSDPQWDECLDIFSKGEAESLAEDYRGHIVELVDAPAKIAVSEAEAEMLEQAKDDYCAASVISAYSTEHIGAMGQDRLMRAYVNGYTVVEKPKRYVLPMEGTKLADGTIAYATLDHTGVWTIKAYSKKQSAVAFHNTVTKSDIDAAPDWVKSIKAVEVAEHDDEGA